MPESDPVVRTAAIELIRANSVKVGVNIIDIGVGSGFYGRTLREMFPKTKIFGVEIWPAYLTPQHLEWYSAVIFADALKLDYGLFHNTYISPSLLIAADVVEHFEKQDAIKLVNTWKMISDWVIITLPIQDCPQGEYMGNVHETHRHQYNIEEVEKDLGLKLVKDCGMCGLFESRRE